jgi:hypothetical protein
MSDLPKYSRIPGFEASETESLVKGRGSLDGTPAYPPRAEAQASGAGPHNITYTFVPQWPVPGKRTNVLGVLGRDTDVSIQCPHYVIAIGSSQLCSTILTFRKHLILSDGPSLN